ncbi:uncharacterized protein LOC106640245 isoform X2 [Copidosoma floridanum]|uniref:uncharacterized protein LOC106640245 isoform X2 n=1 Tax=Copidosoma floridanum TaxID=29053 RepID=UPI0006C993E3|nr:uncharacterized protein LOC106640245 isoform X2 [Copidosoma floridanum]
MNYKSQRAMHGLDGYVAGLLRDTVTFLESLDKVELPNDQSNLRENLLERLGTVLERSAELAEPYIEMGPGACRSMPLLTPGDMDDEPLEEYVPADATPKSQRGSLQHYYEAFQEFRGNRGSKRWMSDKTNGIPVAEEGLEIDEVVLRCGNFTAAQAKDKATKSGTLIHLTAIRKMFSPLSVFWLNRQHCWISLVGSHLLLYGSEKDNRPHSVLPLQKYRCRAAPGSLARDRRHKNTTFELYCPGERTYQFAAKSDQQMRDWIAAVTKCHVDEAKDTLKTDAIGPVMELRSKCVEQVKERIRQNYEDVLVPTTPPKPKEKKSVTVKVEESPAAVPALPARVRRLPSLPSQESLKSSHPITYEPREEADEDEGLYHKIEDLKAQREYQNFPVPLGVDSDPRGQSPVQNQSGTEQELYGKVVKSANASMKSSNESDESSVHDQVRSRSASSGSLSQNDYDDVRRVKELDGLANVAPETRQVDVEVGDKMGEAESAKAEEVKEQTETAVGKKPRKKRSFLDRMRTRKLSLKLKDDKTSSKTASMQLVLSTPPTAIQQSVVASAKNHESSSPNSVKSLILSRTDSAMWRVNEEVEQKVGAKKREKQVTEGDYVSPPPPRPIYSSLPAVTKCVISQDIYDDGGADVKGCKGCTKLHADNEHCRPINPLTHHPKTAKPAAALPSAEARRSQGRRAIGQFVQRCHAL